MQRPRLSPDVTAVVLPDWRVVFVAVPKTGCTSFLWALAQLQGEDSDAFSFSLQPEVAPSLTIHDRSLWRKTPGFDQLSDEQIEQVGPENGWLVFSVSRDPLARLWSAWQSKLLLREPSFTQRFGAERWFPRLPSSLEQCRSDFRRFVEALGSDRDLLGLDAHWRPQSEVLGLPGVAYTHLGKMEEVERSWGLLDSHARRLGWRGSIVRRHENRSLLPLSDRWLDDEVVARVHELYSTDYALLGYDSSSVPLRSASQRDDRDDSFYEQAISCMAVLVERHERVRTLSAVSMLMAAQIAELTSKTNELMACLPSAIGTLASG